MMNRRDFLKSLCVSALYGLMPYSLRGLARESNSSAYQICDVHIHLIGISPQNGCYVSPNFQQSFVYKLQELFIGVEKSDSPEKQDKLYVQKIIQLLESSSEHKYGILLALDGVYDSSGRFDRDRTGIYIPNDYLFDVCRRSKKLVPGASINPMRADALQELEKVAESGAKLIKWIPNSQNFDPSNKAFIPFYRRLAEFKIPVLSHGGREYAVPALNQSCGNPRLLRAVLDEGVKVIVAHCAEGGGDENGPFFFQFLDMLEEYPNLYGDISALTMIHKSPRLRYLLEHSELFERLYYGSDFPLQFFPMTSPLYFADRLSVNNAWDIQKIENVLKRDVETLKMLGIPRECFERGLDLVNR